MAKQNRFANASRQVTINGHKTLVSSRRGKTELPAAVLKDLFAEAGQPEKVCDRIYRNWHERGGTNGYWSCIREEETLPNGITVSKAVKRVWVVDPNPFEGITEPHLRNALKQRGYL